MKTVATVAGSVALAIAALALANVLTAEEAKPKATLKIGVYDSRCVALAYGRSEEQLQAVRAMKEEYEKAKTAKNDARVKELEQEVPWHQVRLHQQVFSTAGVTDIMAKVKDQLPAIASQAGVAAIVSKWEMPYQDGSVETVDVTLAIAKLFKPTDQTLKIIDQMKTQEPVPFEKLPLDPRL